MVTNPESPARRTVRRPSLRGDIVSASLELLRKGDAVSLDSAAKAVGLTKPGLMYHFKTKESLVEAMVDHVLDGYERTFRRCLGVAVEGATADQRMLAYVRWAVEGEHDAADLVMMSDPRLRNQMTERWAQRLEEWTDVPEDLDAGHRARLISLRMMADGLWFADATGVLPLAAEEKAGVMRVAVELLEGANP
jgi:AcrR family transcriptional regulator